LNPFQNYANLSQYFLKAFHNSSVECEKSQKRYFFAIFSYLGLYLMDGKLDARLKPKNLKIDALISQRE
jgi:hypothetical protein